MQTYTMKRQILTRKFKHTLQKFLQSNLSHYLQALLWLLTLVCLFFHLLRYCLIKFCRIYTPRHISTILIFVQNMYIEKDHGFIQF